jgi:hypothetical protein
LQNGGEEACFAISFAGGVRDGTALGAIHNGDSYVKEVGVAERGG